MYVDSSAICYATVLQVPFPAVPTVSTSSCPSAEQLLLAVQTYLQELQYPSTNVHVQYSCDYWMEDTLFSLFPGLHAVCHILWLGTIHELHYMFNCAVLTLT